MNRYCKLCGSALVRFQNDLSRCVGCGLVYVPGGIANPNECLEKKLRIAIALLEKTKRSKSK